MCTYHEMIATAKVIQLHRRCVVTIVRVCACMCARVRVCTCVHAEKV